MASRSENFTGTTGAAINGRTPSDGLGAWVSTNGGTIQSNAFAHNGSNPEVNYLECSATDVDITVTLTVVPGAFGKAGIVCRVADSTNFWYAYLRSGSTAGAVGTWVITKRVAGTDTGVVSGAGPAMSSGDIVRLNVVADRIRLYYTPVSTGVESLILDTGTGQTFGQTNTKHGLGGSFMDSTARWDNLVITDLSTGTAWSKMTFKSA